MLQIAGSETTNRRMSFPSTGVGQDVNVLLLSKYPATAVLPALASHSCCILVQLRGTDQPYDLFHSSLPLIRCFVPSTSEVGMEFILHIRT
eukprot:6413380-Amphidinium_carterae.1